MKEFSKKKVDLLIMYLLFLVIGFIGYLLKFNFLLVSLIFVGVPAMFMLYKIKGIRRKVVIYSLLFTIPLVLIIDPFAHQSHSWFETTVFPFRVFNSFPLESFIWTFNMNVFIVGFYEYFFDRTTGKKISKNFKQIEYLLIMILSIVLLIVAVNPTYMNVPYFYLILVSIIIAIIITGFIKNPQLYSKATLVGVMLFPPFIMHEFLSLRNGNWFFENGFHVGYLSLFGFTFPIEELLFIFFFATALVVIYELFVDDKK